MKKSPWVIASILGLVAFAPSARSETKVNTFQARCTFTKSSDGTTITDSRCRVEKEYADGRLTGTTIQWSDGVQTKIVIETVNPAPRMDSSHGEASVDGFAASYMTFSDGTPCFMIKANQNRICYR